MNKPVMTIIAGPNGAGKSTLTEDLFKRNILDKSHAYINPDVIAKDGGFAPVAAGKIALSQRDKCLEECKSFIMESTLSGNSEIRLMQQAKNKNFSVIMHFVSIERMQTSFSRVKQRVKQGGHNIPTADIVRRYEKCFENLKIAIQLTHKLYIHNNEPKKTRLLLVLNNGQSKFVAQSYEGRLSDVLADFRKSPTERLKLSIINGRRERVRALIQNGVTADKSHGQLIQQMKSSKHNLDPTIEKLVNESLEKSKTR
jgi:predicted ABC-type ATPase